MRIYLSFTALLLFSLLAQKAVAFQGTEGVGGGNALDGKPMEAYQVDITALQAYKDTVQGIVSAVSQDVPAFGGLLVSGAKDKAWYFVPVHLEELPHDTTGLDFETDQVVIQSQYAVWVDQERFDALSESGQVELVLHELVMGVLWSGRESLTSADHDAVRAVTDYIISDYAVPLLPKKTPPQMSAFLDSNDFPGYAAGLNDSAAPAYSLERFYGFLAGLQSNAAFPAEHPSVQGDRNSIFDGCNTRLAWDSAQHELTTATFYMSSNNPVINQDLSQPIMGPSFRISTSQDPLRLRVSPYEVDYLLIGEYKAFQSTASPQPVIGDHRDYALFSLTTAGMTAYKTGNALCASMGANGACVWDLNSSLPADYATNELSCVSGASELR